ncbi:Dehydrogenase [Enhygromyxa salina]|uniref:Dehydrogenase n=1 Tax=Enhygromyxa salina TaxID=215803 RepID=A0A0C1ZTY0_9BACT|nr:SDR family oxidoreductase [Enhygromyxa salina]KIG14513.1 Dehydrogenase [Enhygromyxa salina]
MSAREVVVITGASAGIGRALARRFAREGASIGLLARGGLKLTATVEEVEELGGRALAIEVDVADPEAVEAAATQIEEELGPIDIWINNAGVAVAGRIMDMSPDEIRRVSDVTYHGAAWGTRAALARMSERGRGTIVQIGSGTAYQAVPMLTSYSAAKHALRGFTNGLRAELLHDGTDVHLTMVHPSAINTPFYTWARNLLPYRPVPLRPVYQPELAADIIYWAAHARRRDVYLGWATVGAIFVDQLAPGLADRLLVRNVRMTEERSEPAPPDQLDHLFDPVEVDLGARGRFNHISQSRAPLVRLVARLSGIRGALADGLYDLLRGRRIWR